MKFTKWVTTSTLTLALVGSSLPPAMAEKQVAVQQETVNTSIQENEDGTVVQNYEEDFGSDTWKYVKTLVAIYNNQPLIHGEFKNEFHIASNDHDVRYNIANRGSNTSTWKIFNPKGEIWNNGTLKPGESKTYTAFWDLHDIPMGEYKISIISNNGGAGEFDFTVSVLN
ncbi:hypothetical protein [Lysinibacillus sp. G4S2]|uniref:hypothetical protein n=1 Tax=Lysinibacillus sp. G4S2 TaxID=3055859 RepID=UPI0025A0A48F|nr:hypothetical protein [Lysinibacillus sp. G4S2]MDM5248610.1 hypothetical protein [Lysinibacillus sp. G4S2]